MIGIFQCPDKYQKLFGDRSQMHPINSHNFGTRGLAVSYYNGTSVVNGYIVKQLGPTKFNVTDGSHPKTVLLAPTTAIATALSSNPTYFTIQAFPSTATSSGATFVAHYGVNAATIAAPGSGYTNGTQTLTLASTGSATLSVTVAGNVVTAVGSVSAPGTVTALPSNPVATTGGGGTGATFNLTYKLLSVTVSGGHGYSVGETLKFNGMTASVVPAAHISVVTAGAPATIVVDTAGSGISVAATSFGVTGAVEYVSHIYDNRIVTTAGHAYGWLTNSTFDGTASIGTFS